MAMIEIPAHVQHESYVQNKIQVVGGTNWDLSRSAVETPIARVPEPLPEPEVLTYKPEHRMPAAEPAVTITYEKNAALLTKQSATELKGLTKKSTVLVAGHADFDEKNPEKLANKRAQSVAVQLKRQGHKVEAVRSFADNVPKTQNPEFAEQNRRVEVFER